MTVQCRNCKKTFLVGKVAEVVQYGKDAPRRYVVKCPHCGTENSVNKPKG
jgi:RNase P subunit RPR2